jgi:hypothetical protein
VNAATAQDAYRRMLRACIAPPLRKAAAIKDEDVQVRWVARYAFRLAERETSTDAAGPASG